MGSRGNDIRVRAENVSLMYNLSREREERLKEYVINLVRKRLFFDPFWALNDISFSLERGDSLGIIGHNGAGKSSLLKLISGIMKPTKGRIQTRGVIAPMVELGGGFDSSMSAKQNIFFSGAMHGFSKKYINERYEKIIEFAELEEFADVPVKNFSSGMVSKLAFAIATLISPDILIADEVLAVGDISFRKKCETRMQEIIDRGAIILFVSHSVEQVKKICKKTMWLDHGKMMMYGESAEVCSAYVEYMKNGQELTVPSVAEKTIVES